MVADRTVLLPKQVREMDVVKIHVCVWRYNLWCNTILPLVLFVVSRQYNGRDVTDCSSVWTSCVFCSLSRQDSPPFQKLVALRIHGLRDEQTELQSAVSGVFDLPSVPCSPNLSV